MQDSKILFAVFFYESWVGSARSKTLRRKKNKGSGIKKKQKPLRTEGYQNEKASLARSVEYKREKTIKRSNRREN
jgi:hypothetical protein